MTRPSEIWRSQPASAASKTWLIAPHSVTWRVNREAVLLLAGPRALLLQLAHPLVAAGVAEHSAFPADALRRLRRTIDAMLGMSYGTPEEAQAIAEALRGTHARVQGRLAEGVGAYPPGTPYDALDPALSLWVYATLIDSSVVAYREFVGSLSAGDCERYFEESKPIARLLSLGEKDLPTDYAALRSYIDHMLSGDRLEVTATARRLADAVLHPPLPLLPRALGDLGSVLTLGLLPAPLRARYGYAWEGRHRLGWKLARGIVRSTLPLLPDWLRAMPHARRAERRAIAG